jgi:hypothetical protein
MIKSYCQEVIIQRQSSTDILKFDVRTFRNDSGFFSHKFVADKKLFGNIPLPVIIHLFSNSFHLSSDKTHMESLVKDVNIKSDVLKDIDDYIIIYNVWYDEVRRTLYALKNPEEKTSDYRANVIRFFRDEHYANMY